MVALTPSGIDNSPYAAAMSPSVCPEDEKRDGKGSAAMVQVSASALPGGCVQMSVSKPRGGTVEWGSAFGAVHAL